MTEETKPSVEATVREIRRGSRRKYSAEEKVRIVLEGIVGRIYDRGCADEKASTRTCITSGARIF